MINMFIANDICVRYTGDDQGIEAQGIFQDIDAIILHRNRLRVKQAYPVPFKRNSDRIKDQQLEYVQIWFFILYLSTVMHYSNIYCSTGYMMVYFCVL